MKKTSKLVDLSDQKNKWLVVQEFDRMNLTTTTTDNNGTSLLLATYLTTWLLPIAGNLLPDKLAIFIT
jgi:hypothetical protein